jgi:hypothetical protein
VSLIPSHWYYNTESGQLTKGNNLLNLGNNLLGGLGWHELNIPGDATAAQATAEAEKEFPQGKKPTTAGITAKRVLQTAASQAGASFSIPGLGTIGNFFSGLTQANLWIRVLKGVIGGALMLVGIAKLTGVQKGIAGTAVKVAPLL